ncbi:MAG: radical SAM protein [Candidatus Aenigmatarchaeota archaeon]
MDDKIERLKLWHKKKAGPFLIEIWPTNRCNLKCVMCGTWAKRKMMEKRGVEYNPIDEIKNEVSEERLIELVKESKEMGAREFLITGGGEPFVRKATTLKLMNEIKNLNFFGNLNTNGTLLKKEDIREIVGIDWDMIMFSVDAPYAKLHDEIRGVKNCFKKVKENLLRIKKEKKKSRKDKPKVVFNTVLSNKIYDKIDKLIKLASEVGCEDITFIPLIPFDEEVKKLELSENQRSILNKKINEILRISEKLGVKTNLTQLNFFISSDKMDYMISKDIENSPRDIANSPCFEPFLHFLIKANGEATFCCMIENSPENIKEKSLREIWFGKYFDQQRRNFINKVVREECKFCVFTQFVKNREIRRKLSSNFS